MRDAAALRLAHVEPEGRALPAAHQVRRVGLRNKAGLPVVLILYGESGNLAEDSVVASCVAGGAGPAEVFLVAPVQAAQRRRSVADPPLSTRMII